MDRFTMAVALVDRAESKRRWIGDDHGDPYEQVMLAGVVSEEVQIVTKEIFEHLRAALDYCAQSIWQKFSGYPTGARVYFPIARANETEAGVRRLVDRNMPGVVAASPAALDMLQSFQEFSRPENAWLPELAMLVNRAKHDNLEIINIPPALLNMTPNSAGVMILSFKPGHAPKRGVGWMMLRQVTDDATGGGEFEAFFLQLRETKVEFSGFLRDAVAGTGNIIKMCRSLN